MRLITTADATPSRQSVSSDLERAIRLYRDAGRTDEALALADRLCRLAMRAPPEALMIRAEILAVLGRVDEGLADAAFALAQSCDHWGAAAFVLRHARQVQARRAAAEIVLAARAGQADAADQRAALLQMKAAGAQGWACLYPTLEGIEGWAAFDPDARASLTVVTGANGAAHDLVPSRNHPLSDVFGRACAIRIRLPPSTRLAQLNIDGVIHASIRFPRWTPAPSSAASAQPCALQDPDPICLVVMVGQDPVLAGRCVGDLLAYRPAGVRLILAAPAAPRPDMADFLHRMSGVRAHVVQAPDGAPPLAALAPALELAGGADVLLLDAGTILQSGAIERLRAAAHSAPDIALAVPWSNSGPFVGLPHPFGGPAPARDRMAQTDRLAARLNSGVVRDLPTGSGHCLYLTRQGLDATPFWCEGWERLDLEAAAHGLRARARGWRTICAADVFAGHDGAPQAVDTLREPGPPPPLAERFAGHAAACAGFASFDPLSDLRAVLASALPYEGPAPLLRVVGPRLAGAARMLPETGAPRLLLEVEGTPMASVARVSLDNAIGAWRLPFTLASQSGPLLQLLRQHRVRAVEVIGVEPLPDPVWAILCALGRPISVQVLDLRLEDRDRVNVGGSPRLCSPEVVPYLHSVQAANDQIDGRLRSSPLVAGVRLDAPLRRFRPPGPDSDVSSGGRLAILSAVASPAADRLITALLAQRPPRRAQDAVFVFGPVLHEAALLSRPFVFPLGRVEAREVAGLVARHDIRRLVVADPEAMGHPLAQAGADLPYPLAFFDSGAGGGDRDLSLEMTLSAEDAAARICTWMESLPPHERSASPDARFPA